MSYVPGIVLLQVISGHTCKHGFYQQDEHEKTKLSRVQNLSIIAQGSLRVWCYVVYHEYASSDEQGILLYLFGLQPVSHKSSSDQYINIPRWMKGKRKKPNLWASSQRTIFVKSIIISGTKTFLHYSPS